MAEALAIAVSGILAGGIATRGSAVLVVSGGSTPKRFFDHLSCCEIEWEKVSIVLVDERIVPIEDPASNFGTAQRDFFDRVPIPSDNLHPMPVYDTPETGAAL